MLLVLQAFRIYDFLFYTSGEVFMYRSNQKTFSSKNIFIVTLTLKQHQTDLTGGNHPYTDPL